MENKEEISKTELNEEDLDSIVGGEGTCTPPRSKYQGDQKMTTGDENFEKFQRDLYWRWYK